MKKISSLATLLVVLLLLVVPMLTLTASAEETTATLTFDDTAKRTTFSTSKQVWEENGITFTNNKGSGSNVADYAKPVRLYKSSSITIEAPGNITKIVFDCNSSSYATELKTSIGASATASSDKVTVELDGTSKTYTVAQLSGQVRLDSLTVTYAQETVCEHTNTTTTNSATCIESGEKLEICNDCDKVLSNETAPATGHNYADGVCSNCGQAETIYTCTFTDPSGTTTSTAKDKLVMPAAPSLSSAYDKYTFIGWATNTVDNSTDLPTVYQPNESIMVDSDIAFYAVYSYDELGAEVTEYVKKDISDITATDVVVITMSNGSAVHAMSNNNGTSKAPTAVVLTTSGNKITGTVDDTIKWNISNSGGTITIYPNGVTNKWLYCINDNNGVRVGTGEAKTFKIESSKGYLFNNGQSRYIGVYNKSDWRSYTSINSNITGQTLSFYVKTTTIGTTTHYTTTPEADMCQHSDTVTETIAATCTGNGAITVRCTECNEVISADIIPATGHLDTSVTTVNATCTENGSHITTCNDCGNTVSRVEIPSLGHDLVDEICVRCGYTASYTPPSTQPAESGWTLVTNASQLKPGDKIIIVANSSGSLFTAGDISNSIMASISVTDATFKTLPNGVVILTLGGSEGAWTLTNESSGKKLGATAVKKVAWGSGTTTWTISISDGKATIQNSNSSYGKFLYNVTSPRFTTYTSNTSTSMLLPQIYKYEEAEITETEEIEIYGASMTVGSTLAMNYYISGFDGTDYYMVFTMNGKTYRVDASTEKHGYLVFTFDNIPPQMMGDTITAKIYKNGSTTVLDETEISVKEYAEKIIDAYGDDSTLMDLVADMLKYGAAAQKYVGYKANVESLVTYGIDLDGKGSDAAPTAEDNLRKLKTEQTEIDKSIYSFTAAGVRFDFNNKVYVKFKTDDISKITLYCNDTDVSDRIEDLGDGTYVFYTDGIDATEFGKSYVFNLHVDGELHQTLTYSVNSYAYAKFTDEQTTAVDELALALYRYGLSAKAYTGR